MTASTPPLVDVIAGVLREHYVGIDPRHNGLRCECGQAVQTDDAAHQARAVLDALEQAGGLEWGVRYDDAPLQRCHSHEYAELCAADNQDGNPVTVSRITGPWTAVEG